MTACFWEEESPERYPVLLIKPNIGIRYEVELHAVHAFAGAIHRRELQPGSGVSSEGDALQSKELLGLWIPKHQPPSFLFHLRKQSITS